MRPLGSIGKPCEPRSDVVPRTAAQHAAGADAALRPQDRGNVEIKNQPKCLSDLPMQLSGGVFGGMIAWSWHSVRVCFGEAVISNWNTTDIKG